MNARVVTAMFQPGKVDEGVLNFRDTVVPRAKEYPGFMGALMLTEPSTGKVIALTLWETEAEMRATDTGYQKSVGSVAGALAGPPTQESYEVSVRV